jgi:hypothetical protein
MKISIDQTTLGRNSNISNYAKNASKFLIDHVDDIVLPKEVEYKLLNTQDTIVKTIIGELYHQAVAEDKLSDIFTLLDLNSISKIPSWFLISWLDIDVLALQTTDKNSYSVISSMTNYRDKILVDITPYINRKTGKIKDLTGFQVRIIRNLLTRSYYQFDNQWLSTNLIYLITKFYSLAIGGKISSVYNLTVPEQSIIATILAVHFTNRCTTSKDIINPIMYKMDFLTRNVDIKTILNHIDSKYKGDTFSLSDVVEVMIELGPSRMDGFTLSTFFSMNANLLSNNLMSLLSLEYPPYFVIGLLEAISGSKSSLLYLLKNMQLNKDIQTFTAEILRTKSFIHALV